MSKVYLNPFNPLPPPKMNQKLYYIKSRIDPNLPWVYLQPYNAPANNHVWGLKETATKVRGDDIPKEFQTTDYDIEACPEGEDKPEIDCDVAQKQRFVRREGEPWPELKVSAREAILRESIQLICREREEDYGSPDDSFATIANLWSAYLEAKAKKLSREGGHKGPALFYYLTPKDVAILNILQKVSRLVTSPDKRDGWVDIAGYAGLGGGMGG